MLPDLTTNPSLLNEDISRPALPKDRGLNALAETLIPTIEKPCEDRVELVAKLRESAELAKRHDDDNYFKLAKALEHEASRIESLKPSQEVTIALKTTTMEVVGKDSYRETARVSFKGDDLIFSHGTEVSLDSSCIPLIGNNFVLVTPKSETPDNSWSVALNIPESESQALFEDLFGTFDYGEF